MRATIITILFATAYAAEEEAGESRRHLADLVVTMMDTPRENREETWASINLTLDTLKVVTTEFRLATMQEVVEEFRPEESDRLRTFILNEIAGAEKRRKEEEEKKRKKAWRIEWPRVTEGPTAQEHDEARTAKALLLEIHFAQEVFKRQTGSYWTRDVSGLFRAKLSASAAPLKLVSLGIACSDESPCVPLDLAGRAGDLEISAIEERERTAFEIRMLPVPQTGEYVAVCMRSLDGRKGRCFLIDANGEVRWNDVTAGMPTVPPVWCFWDRIEDLK